MKQRIRQPFLSVFKIVMILLLIATIVTSSVLFWNFISAPKSFDDEVTDTKEIQSFDYSVNDYTLFDLEEFSFRFILANITVNSDRAINISLSNFRTSENIQLNSVNTYLNEIEQAGYNFGNYSVIFGLNSEASQIEATLFIPILDDSLDTIDLDITLNPNKTLSFDLNNPSGYGLLTDLGTNQVIVSPTNVAEITFLRELMVAPDQFYQLDSNGARIPANFSSQSQIYGVKIDIRNLGSEPFRITKAFITTRTNETYLAVDNNYIIDGVDNLNNSYIEIESSGYVFFEVLGVDFITEDFIRLDLYLSNLESDNPYQLDLLEAR